MKIPRNELIDLVVERMIESISQTDPGYFEDYFYEREYESLHAYGSDSELIEQACELGLIGDDEEVEIIR